jgi:hypothetical protein
LPIKKRQSNQSVYQLCYWYFMGVTVWQTWFYIAHPEPTEDELGAYEVVLH